MVQQSTRQKSSRVGDIYMITGLKVWDRQGNELTSLIGRYPKFVGKAILTESSPMVEIDYVAPEGTRFIVVYAYLNANNFLKQTGEASEQDTISADKFTYNLWKIEHETPNAHHDTHRIYATGDDKAKPPIVARWGYV